MERQYIFIDDSGDPGFKKSPSSHFIIAAVLLMSKDERDLLNDAIDVYRRELGWNDLDEFKFKATNKRIVLDLIDFVRAFDFRAYVMVLDKARINLQKSPRDKASLYHYAIKELLLRLSLECPVITIDGNIGKRSVSEIRTYLRQNLKNNGITKSQVHLVDSRKNSLVQLADIVAGAVARSYKSDKKNANAFRKALGDKIIKVFILDL